MNKNKKISCIIFIGIFIIMLICNALTDLVADDFAYNYDFRNGEKITGFFQIFGSMKGHALSMNGRLCAHFFAQLFLLLPKWIFNIVNAFAFTLLISLIYKIASDKKTDNAVYLGVFASVWVFAPAFGQIFLWLDGSCNYLWSYVAGMLFVLPYTKRFLQNVSITKLPLKIAFLCLSFIMGAYSENASPAFICTATLLLAINFIFYKTKPRAYEIISLLLSVAGYITLYLAPAQLNNKSAQLTLSTLSKNFGTALKMYLQFAPIFIVFTILFVMALVIKADKKKVWMSLSFFIGSLLSNFMMIVASYYHDRSSAVAFLLLLIATFILWCEISATRFKPMFYGLLAAVLILNIYFGYVGLKDIIHTHQAIEQNQIIVQENKRTGIMDIELPIVTPKTKYSALYNLRYLSDETAQTWPNAAMAKYYEVNSIIGK